MTAQPIKGLGTDTVPTFYVLDIKGSGSDATPACNAVKIPPINEPAKVQKDEEGEWRDL